MNQQNPTPPTRRHDIDALRVLAFVILIFYHVGMFYVADWSWHVKSTHLSEPLQAVMMAVNPWRMPLLFFVSGVATHFLLGKMPPAKFAGARIQRLLIPLLFGMAVIVPPQAYLQAVSNNAFEGSYPAFLWRYVTFQPWPPNAFDGWRTGITWNHLWYLPYLLTYTLLLALFFSVVGSQRLARWRAKAEGLKGFALVSLPVLPFMFYQWVLQPRFPVTHALIDDWYSHAAFITIFLMGYWVGDSRPLWGELRRLRWVTLVGALAGYLWVIFIKPEWESSSIRVLSELSQVLPSLSGWFALLTVLGWAHHALNKPFRWLPYATEAVYPWYILHQTLTVVAGYWLAQLPLGPIIEPVLVVLATIVGCLCLHEFFIRRSSLLRPLFGVKPMGAGRAETGRTSLTSS